MDDVIALVIFGIIAFLANKFKGQFGRQSQDEDADSTNASEPVTIEELPENTRRMLFGDQSVPTARPATPSRVAEQLNAGRPKVLHGFGDEAEEDEEGVNNEKTFVPTGPAANVGRVKPILVSREPRSTRQPVRAQPVMARPMMEEIERRFEVPTVTPMTQPQRSAAPPIPTAARPGNAAQPSVQQTQTVEVLRRRQQQLEEQKRKEAAKKKETRPPSKQRPREEHSHLMRFLRSKQGPAYGIMLSEILGPPKALQ